MGGLTKEAAAKVWTELNVDQVKAVGLLMDDAREQGYARGMQEAACEAEAWWLDETDFVGPHHAILSRLQAVTGGVIKDKE